jgi:hypothetical protein
MIGGMNAEMRPLSRTAHGVRLFATAKPSTAHGEFRERVTVVVTLTALVDVAGTALVWLFEHDTATVNSPWDAFFWCTTQLLTVSSQLPLPTTTGGRIVDLALEAWAITAVTALAGLFSHFFRRRHGEVSD